MALSNTQKLKDFDIYDTILPGGRPYILYNDDALKNELIFWITSTNGDYVRNPSFGGNFNDLLYKPLSTLPKTLLTKYERLIDTNFGNFITINNLSIEPDIETQSWVVTLEWISKLTNQSNTTILAIDNKVTPIAQKTTYINVTLDGENLYNYVLLKLPSMTNQTLSYEESESSYVWGNLKLTNLTISDPYFNAIQLAINGF